MRRIRPQERPMTVPDATAVAAPASGPGESAHDAKIEALLSPYVSKWAEQADGEDERPT